MKRDISGFQDRFAGAALVLLAALLLATPPAQAAPRAIAGPGAGAGKVDNPGGVDIDRSSGDLYVADRSNFRVDKFDSEGNFLLAWGFGVADGTTEELQTCGPAAEPPTARCFVHNPGGTGNAIAPNSVAVEQSSGDVYVSESEDIAKFTPSGRLIYMAGRNVNKTKKAEAGATQAEKDFCTAASGDTCRQGDGGGAGGGEFAFANGLAFDSEGKLWVNDAGARLQRFESDGSFLEEVAPPAGTQAMALAIDPATDDFYALGSEGRNEAQKISAPGSSSGEYTLSFEGQTTEPLPAVGAQYTGPGLQAGLEAAEAIEAALEALSTIGPGDVHVSPTFANFEVVFIHDLGGRDVPQLLASGGSPAVTVQTNTQGKPGSVERLDPSGALIDTLDDGPGDIPRALAVDSAGELFVGDTGLPYHFLEFSPSGEQVAQFGAGQVAAGVYGNQGPGGSNALAVDELTKALYAANGTDGTVKRYPLPEPGPLLEDQRVEGLEPTTATLAAELNPEGHETTYHFEWGTSESYSESSPSEVLAGEGFDSETVEVELEELNPSTTYHFRLCASNSAGSSCGPDTGFTTRPAVAIDAQWATGVAAASAALHAELDPLGVAGEWWIEYGTSESYGSSTARAALPASFGDIPVGALLSGLESASTYHYRFAASDERDGAHHTVHGVDQTFTTQLSGLDFQLADNRAWEMVTPPDKHGALITSPNGAQGQQIQGAADGQALAYLSINSVQADPEGSRPFEGSSVLARRGPGGWDSTDITPPHTEASPPEISVGDEYVLFSRNLDAALLEARDATPLSPAASERTPYLRYDTVPPTYVPLVSGCPEPPQPCPAAVEAAADVPAGTEFGGDLSYPYGPVKIHGATPDLSHVVFASEVPLAGGAAAGSIYEWSGGRLQPVSVKPAGEGGATVSATLGSGNNMATRNAISEDGSRVFWSWKTSTQQHGGNGLYLRDTARGETLRLDTVQPGAFGAGKVEPLFQGAGAEGTVAFFTDPQNLTEDANEEGVDLYRWQAEGTGGCEAAGGCLTDLTAGVPHAGEAADVQGLLPGIAEDGSAAYFVARGVLDTRAGAHGDSAAPGQPNLYLWRQGQGVRYIATLSSEDDTDWGRETANSFNQTAAASPSGRYLAFMSQRSLTGYDNRDAASGALDQEVFRYDAANDELVCASCDPSGARPAGTVAGSESFLRYYDWQKLWDGRAVAAVLPEPTARGIRGELSPYRSRYVQDDGRVFFNAADSLVPADSNGGWDVYEYEPPKGAESAGADTCTPSAGGAATSLTSGGCVSLLSSGTGEGETGFIDAAEGGSDVFFFSLAQLSVTDEDHEMDIYDARVDGEPAQLQPAAECLGEACQPPASAPALKTPASAGFRGPGNVREKGARGRCATATRKARRLTRRLHRAAQRAAPRRGERRTARRMNRLAHRARRVSGHARRCRRSERSRASRRAQR